MPHSAAVGSGQGCAMPTVELHAHAGAGEAPAPAPGLSKLRSEQAPTPAHLRFSTEGDKRTTGTLRALAGKYMGQPGFLSFSGGFPHPSLFPFAKLSLTTTDGHTIELSGPQLLSAQQYNYALRGYPPLLAWAERHTAALHRPPAAAGHEVMITNGGNHTLDLALALFLDRGDSFLLEEYSYPVAVESIAVPKGYRAVGVPIDGHGIIPAALEKVLVDLQARALQPGAPPFPRLLYTIPHGQNPTGCTIPLHRKKEVYAICRRYGLAILEDDPYAYLQFRLAPSGDPVSRARMPGLHGVGAGGSYLSLDSDGRVIRVDTFAKFMAPGLRLGWVTAHPAVIQKLVCMIQQHTVGPCSLSQVVVAETLAAWGEEGLDAHLRTVQAEYARRAVVMLRAAQRELTGLAEWGVPSAGMFLWLRLLGEADAAEVWQELCEESVIMIPGKPMHWRCEDPSFLSPYLRVSYSAASDEAIEEGFRRVGAVLRRRRTAAATAAVHGPPVAPAPAVPAEGSPGRPAAMVRGDSAYGGAATVWGHAGRPQLRRV